MSDSNPSTTPGDEEIDEATVALNNAKANLAYFGTQLGLSDLEFDANNTCILGIDDSFSMHLTYQPGTKKLYVYSPILDGLPDDPAKLLILYETLLQGSMLGGQMASGGVGLAKPDGLVLMHWTFEMQHASEDTLSSFASIIVDQVELWRKRAYQICFGKPGETPISSPSTDPQTTDPNQEQGS